MFPKDDVAIKIYKTLPKTEIEKLYKEYKADYEKLKDSKDPSDIGRLIVVAWVLGLLEDILNDKKKGDA